MKKYSEYVNPTFLLKWQAEFYAFKARRKGFTTTVFRNYDRDFFTGVLGAGAPWIVSLERK